MFEDLPQEPVPSLLRDFSAPVIVEYPYEAGQLAFLAAHDSDPFNRWEAGQRLALDAMLAVMGGADPHRAAASLLDVFAATLRDQSLDPAFRQLMLSLPGETVLSEHLPVVDPTLVRQSRNAIRALIGGQLTADWQQTWQ